LESLEQRTLLAGMPTISLTLQATVAEVDGVGESPTVINGTIIGGDSQAFDIEVDLDGDTLADACLPAVEGTEFTIDLGTTLPLGEQTIQARARLWSESARDYLFGDWGTLTMDGGAPADELAVSDDLAYDAALTDLLEGDGTLADSEAGQLDIVAVEDDEVEGEGEGGLSGPGQEPITDPELEEIVWSDPELESFSYIYEDPNWYILVGRVTYHEPTALRIYFEGGPFTDHSAPVDIDGSFEYAIQIELNDMEYVYAQARADSDDIPDSNSRSIWIN
jgi:hypothetical protein